VFRRSLGTWRDRLPARCCETVLGCEPVAGREQQPVYTVGDVALTAAVGGHVNIEQQREAAERLWQVSVVIPVATLAPHRKFRIYEMTSH
jgi:hypothetical protein